MVRIFFLLFLIFSIHASELTSSNENNKSTQGFYEHLGFIKIAETISKDESPDDFHYKKFIYLYNKAF